MIFATKYGNVHLTETAQHSWVYVSARDEAALKGLWPDRNFYHNKEQRVYWLLMNRKAVWWRMAGIQRVAAKVDPMYLAIREVVKDLKRTNPQGIDYPDGAA